ncbi:hypothetical protein K435DRAFT_776390 [Dendrothele bispora CBS 962.96]|uniref:Uncharacterized protein n=1 Tax=Dendrothele bispora (strain CBS 962.96) TaxID=1314807 RepID=A0A4S8MEE8_DENBC|nr:hypothetical protein K435DRAFT_776390 [Dendrothele bispora CBS 962.96]
MSSCTNCHSKHDESKTMRYNDDQLLDKLDLPLKGFPEIDATPTTGITSLPTPRNEAVELAEAKEAEDILQPLLPSSAYEAMECPGAPRVKDLDSFTEGTGGSFDFLTGPVDECPMSPPALNSLSLSLLPPQDTSMSIEVWREDVFYHSPSSRSPSRVDTSETTLMPSSLTHVKRPRSLASDDVPNDRRIRHRVQSDIASSMSKSLFYDDRIPATFQDGRPRLRRSRSLPYRPDD